MNGLLVIFDIDVIYFFFIQNFVCVCYVEMTPAFFSKLLDLVTVLWH